MGFKASRKWRKSSLETPELEVPDVPIQWRQMLAYLRPYRLRLLVTFLALITSAGLSLVFPAVIQRVIDSVLQERNLALLDSITLGLLAVFLLRSISSLVETYNLNYIGERIVVDLRKQLYAHLQTLSLGFFVERRVGELVSRMSSDITVMRELLTNNLTTLVQQTLIMLGAVVIMFLLNWRLTLFILALVPIIVAFGFIFGMTFERLSTRVQDKIAESTVVSEEVLQNIREVKSFARESYEIERYNRAVDRSLQAALRLLVLRSIFGPTVAFLAFGGLSLILWFGGREVLDGRLSGGELISFLVYGLTVAGSFAALVGLYTSFQQAVGATKRVFQIMATQPTVRDDPDAVELPRVEGRLTFDDVHFRYDERQPVLRGVNLDIQPGEIIALVGPSGAGKSTTFNLIPRFYDPDQGSIRIDGYDLRCVTQASLRAQVGIVPQETMLFGGTIRENILYGRLDASEDELIAAAQAANAHDFITSLPDGYETIVGERGIKLSGGQRQRVAIARAILKDPRILLLDEATSSLDNESEHLVQEALARLMQNRTTIIIAHRLSTVRIAHRIAVMDKGQIVELGTHDELLARDGLYAKLYDMQFRDQDRPVAEMETQA
ncbi:MAG: ABC transporter transmembrane domain-containing protein [Anaerolineae bacterium]|nr:ABC transporter transmembrane domain-containing protein [Anaerolineae bacterium]MDW8171457.1 ABC transporter transmembrane domain-containing protein [Anaerolineae bacterium]